MNSHKQQPFQRLKAPCVELLSITAGLDQKPNARKQLVRSLEWLLDTLKAVSSSLDARLAEYAFVPISQVLRLSRAVPVRALELCLDCISVLLQAGWGGGLSPALSGQLLILFTFMAKPSSTENGLTSSSEELQVLALKCTAELLSHVSQTQEGKLALTATSNIPALGEAVLVMLDALTESNSSHVKLQAVVALEALVSSIADLDALASFLPRIVSSLTKVLTPTSGSRPSFRVVEHGLHVLVQLFRCLLSDRETEDLPARALETSPRDSSKVVRSKSWLQATASQIKLALANVFKLRSHEKIEVRRALFQLCLCVAQECQKSLSDTISMAVETMVTLAGGGGPQNTVENELSVLLTSDSKLSELLRESLRDWIISLPRLMQSKDDAGRRLLINQISTALRLLKEDQAILDDLLAENLRDGFAGILADSKGHDNLVETVDTDLQAQLTSSQNKSRNFPPLQLRLKGQDDMMKEFRLLLQELSKSHSAFTVAQTLVGSVRNTDNPIELASFWISVNLIRDLMTYNSPVDDFLDLGTPSLQLELLDDLYSKSLDFLSKPDLESQAHWHFQALSLEVVALQASRYQTEFRAEMDQTLYPILHHIGSANPMLRQHAITCLNIVADACGYTDASDIVISNVDYIVNAVGLRLTYGDVTPQGPRVLLMMIRLCGPSLLPYLDDLIGSIFGALEMFHGYPKLVELLFSVLKGIAEEGVREPQLAITTNENNMQERDIKEIAPQKEQETLDRLEEAFRKQDEEDQGYTKDSFPRKPWGGTSDDQMDEEEQPPEPSDPPPPAPKIYAILLKISELTQHYLTSSSPTLRTSLFSLLHTTIPALAKHENSFLPLIHTLWPVIIPRLEDPQGYIVASALDTISLMCEYAEDFMRMRIEGIWHILHDVHERALSKSEHAPRKRKPAIKSLKIADITDISASTKGLSLGNEAESYRPEAYVATPSRMIWDSLVRLLCTVSQHVSIKDELVVELLDMLNPVLEKGDVRKALEVKHADAVQERLGKR